MPGPLPKPKKLKILEGGKGNHKDPRKLLKFRVDSPTCPSFLSAYAKLEWKRVVPLLEQADVIAEVDRMALAVYCEAVSEFRRATLDLQDVERVLIYTNDNKGLHPLVKLQEQAGRTIKSFCAEFGFTPGARGRIEIPRGSAAKESKNRSILD